MNKSESMFLEAIGNLLKNNESLGQVEKKETSHFFEEQWNNLEQEFALKVVDSPFHEELTSAFKSVHSYKYLDDPTFTLSLTKRLKTRAVPQEEIDKAVKASEKIISENEQASGWNPNMEALRDVTTNADNRTPKQEKPFTGGGPAPALDEIV
jgi:hypothetical protein